MSTINKLFDFIGQVLLSAVSYLFVINYFASAGYTWAPFVLASFIYLLLPYLVFTSPYWERNKSKRQNLIKALWEDIVAQRNRDYFHRRDIHAKSIACRRWKRKAKSLHREVRKLRGELGKTTAN